jgi:hypothetical protein
VIIYVFVCYTVSNGNPPNYTLSVHSSKGLIVEQHPVSDVALADAVIQLVLSKGERLEVGELLT